MKLNKTFFIGIIAFFVISCGVTKDYDIRGKYLYKSKISSGTLLISEKTFKYEYDVPMDSKKSEGTWKKIKNILVLKSDESYKNDCLDVKEAKVNDENILILVDKDENPITDVDVLFNNGNFIRTTDIHGQINLKELQETIKNIKVIHIGISDDKQFYNIKSIGSNYFKVKIFEKDFAKIYFDDEAFKIEKNKINVGKLIFKKVS